LMAVHNLIISLILDGITTFAASLALSRMEQKRFEKFSKRYLGEMRQKAMLEELVILPSRKRMKFYQELIAYQLGWTEYTAKKEGLLGGGWYAHVFDRHPGSEITEQDILICLRILQRENISKCLCVSLAAFSENAKIFIKSLDGYHFDLMDKNRILQYADNAGWLPEEEVILAKISDAIAQKKLTMDKIKAEIFGGSKFKSYIVTAAVMAGLSILLKFQPFFMSMAALCGILAVMTYYYHPPKRA
ncbi:MAG: hypothetical protein WCP73_04915, partial [Eubacteriales bacterium]